MKQTMTESMFIDQFRAIRPDNFTYYGLKALFEYLEDYEEQTGEEIEFDPIAICCDFSEYFSLEEFRADYGDEYDAIEDIEQDTIVIPVQAVNSDSLEWEDAGFIIQVF